MTEVQVKTLLKKRAYRALCMSRTTPEQKLLFAIIQQAIDDYDRPRCEQRSAIKLLNSWYPQWRADKIQIERHLLKMELATA